MTLAVSACLLGEKRRYDGGHKQFRFLTETLSEFADFVPFCPEHLAFGTPRPSVRLVTEGGDIRVRSNKDGTDLTDPLRHHCRTQLQMLEKTAICGIVFKAKSPSCGPGNTKLHLPNGHTEGKTDGLFVELCKERYALLPMEDEGRLQDPWLRENFVMQIFAYDTYETFKRTDPQMKDLVRFHTVNKFLLQAKDEQLYRELGRIVGNQTNAPLADVLIAYEIGFKQAIARKSSTKRHRNVLEHMSGFFKNDLSSEEKRFLHEQIDDYARRIIPLILPLSTIALYARKYDTTYLLDQTFLDPYPKTLALRSHLGADR